MIRFFTVIIAAVLAFLLVACSTNTAETDKPGESVEQTRPIKSIEPINPIKNTASFDEPDDQKPPNLPAERLGFSGGNIGAGGLVCGGDDGYVYFRSESDGWKLFKAKPDGSDKVKLSDHVPDVINVLDGWVYYKAYTDGFAVYRVRTDGTDETKLADGGYGYLFVAESGIYYEARDERNTSHIYRADLDGSNATLLFSDATLMYYYEGKIYLGAGMLGVYDIETGEEKVLADTYIADVSVDESGIYYWAVDEGEFRRMDLNGGNDSVILHGGDYFNYTNGYLYYMGISENANEPCYIINRLNVETGETITLHEALNELFDAHGELLGITYRQLQNGDYDPDLFEYNSQGEMALKEGGGSYYNESVGYVYVVGQYQYMRAALLESLIQNGEFDCIARLDGGVTIWD